MDYVNEIINNSDSVVNVWGKEHYLYESKKGLIPVNLWKEGDFYFDGCQYIEGQYNKNTNSLESFVDSYNYPFGWRWATPKEFLDIYSEDNQLNFTIYSFRKYGQSKLSKPKELRGIKQVFSIDYIPKKCKCQVFIKNNDVWVKHKDYFSESMEVEPEDIGIPLVYKAKKYLDKDKKEEFVYPDCWGDIVLRNESWICIKNLIYRMDCGETDLELRKQIVRQQEKIHGFHKYELSSSDMERFWEKLIGETRKYLEMEE